MTVDRNPLMQNVAISSIRVMDQVRKNFDSAAHAELVASVQEHGILQPLLVRHDIDTDGGISSEYYLVAGERRLRAAKEAGLETVPVRVMFGQHENHTALQILENVQRQDLTLEETAAGVDALYKHFGNMAEVARKLSKSMPWVSKMYAVANKLGTYATELLAGNHTKDVELLTLITRMEELENSEPRLGTLVSLIEQNKAGRKEAIELHDTLKGELDDEANEGEGSEGGEGGEKAETPNPFLALDSIHEQLKLRLAALGTMFENADSLNHPGSEGVKHELKSVARAYAAHALDWLKDKSPKAASLQALELSWPAEQPSDEAPQKTAKRGAKQATK